MEAGKVRGIQRLRRTPPHFAIWKTLEGIGAVFINKTCLVANNQQGNWDHTTEFSEQLKDLKENSFLEPAEHNAVLTTS